MSLKVIEKLRFSFVVLLLPAAFSFGEVMSSTWATPQANTASEVAPSSWSVPAPKPMWIPIMGDILFFIPAFKKDDSTPGGIDSDSDGVRDDVQAAIDNRYANDEYTRRYSLLMAKVQQEIVATDKDERSVWEATGYVGMLDRCVRGNSADPLAGLTFIQPLLLNTLERTKKYINETHQAHVAYGHFPRPALDCSR